MALCVRAGRALLFIGKALCVEHMCRRRLDMCPWRPSPGNAARPKLAQGEWHDADGGTIVLPSAEPSVPAGIFSAARPTQLPHTPLKELPRELEKSKPCQTPAQGCNM